MKPKYHNRNRTNDSKQSFKVFPIEKLTTGELTVREEKKEGALSSFFGGIGGLLSNRSKKSNDYVRKFSILQARKNQITPTIEDESDHKSNNEPEQLS